ncbi:MAG: metallophosphoesterase [bacterium]|nr:metallophosphoesterase [bacterium]
MTWLGRLLLRRFWWTIALAGALGEWTLVCALVDPPLAPLWHVVAVVLLTLLNRAAAEGYEREAPDGHLPKRAAQAVLATGFVSAAGALTLGAAAMGWMVVDRLGALPADAGQLAAAAAPFLGPGFAAVAWPSVALVMLVATWGYVAGHRRLRVTPLLVSLPGLPPALDGLRIVHLSDLHLGPLADRAALGDVVARLAEIDPDVIVVTGDVVDSKRTDLEAWVPALASIGARHGVYAILGNHDEGAGLDRVAAAIARHTTWTLLRDTVAPVTLHGATLWLVGLEYRDTAAACAVLPELLAQVPAGDAAVLLCHHPAIYETAARLGVPLTLAGHTHGGQLAVPGLPRLNPARILMTRFDAGTFARHGTLLHVNRGLGISGQRIRVGAPREITVVTLLSPSAAAGAA